MSDPFKEMVIDAICGAGFSSRNQAVQFGCKRLGRLDGDDVHGKWMWDRGQLIHMDVSALQELYELVKKTQWAIEPPRPSCRYSRRQGQRAN